MDDDFSIGLRDHHATIEIWLPKTEGMTGSMYKVYLPLLSLLILWISSANFTPGNKKAQSLSSCHALD
jgi:hypothetical protein